jgi:eukaryotic-like serine/threonine-protein kinase
MTMKPLKIGDVIVGEYKIQDIFGGEGKSGMGVVYLVTNRNFPTPFVLKTFQKDEGTSLQRFRSEAKTWVSVGIHQNIVKALFVSEINEQLFVGAEYVASDENGRNSVSAYLEQGGISTIYAIRWTAQFCYGMDYAITKGLKAHRDIKPDNLMVDENGNLKITDFGLSKFNALFKESKHEEFRKGNFFNKLKSIFRKHDTEPQNVGLTNVGSFMGTILYASPEQILDSSKVDFRSDIYSFGIVLYQLITSGSYPFSLDGKTTIEDIAFMHLQEPVSEIDHPLGSIALKCLAKNPNERYQDFKQLLSDIAKKAERLKIDLPKNEIETDVFLRELYIQSYSLRSLGELKKSQELIDKYLLQDTEDTSAWSLKGKIEHELSNIDEGISATLKSYELDPYNSHTCNNLGSFFNEKQDFTNAYKFLHEAIEIDSYNTGAMANLAYTCGEIGNYEEAADLIYRALQIAPDKKTLHFNAGNVAAQVSKQRRFKKAIGILKILVKVDKENSNHWFNLASNFWLTKQHEESINCFKEVEKLLPNDEQTLISLVKLNGEVGNFAEAISYCEKLLDRNLSPVNAICWRAQFIQASGRGNEAIEFIKSVIQNNPTNDHLCITLASLYSNEGENPKAIDMIVKAKRILIENGEKDNKEKIDFLTQQQLYYQKLADDN